MRNLMALTLILAVMGCSHLKPHPRPWTKAEKVLLCASIAAAGADYYTTERFLDRGHTEGNPVLGKRPNDTKLTLIAWGSYGVLILVIHLYPELRIPVLWMIVPINGTFAYRNSTLRDDLNHRECRPRP